MSHNLHFIFHYISPLKYKGGPFFFKRSLQILDICRTFAFIFAFYRSTSFRKNNNAAVITQNLESSLFQIFYFEIWNPAYLIRSDTCILDQNLQIKIQIYHTLHTHLSRSSRQTSLRQISDLNVISKIRIRRFRLGEKHRHSSPFVHVLLISGYRHRSKLIQKRSLYYYL